MSRNKTLTVETTQFWVCMPLCIKSNIYENCHFRESETADDGIDPDSLQTYLTSTCESASNTQGGFW